MNAYFLSKTRKEVIHIQYKVQKDEERSPPLKINKVPLFRYFLCGIIGRSQK